MGPSGSGKTTLLAMIGGLLRPTAGRIAIEGRQGHVAYPHLAANPVRALGPLLAALLDEPLDGGNAHFDRSNLEVTTVDTGNGADNVIPGTVRASFNVRFNDFWTPDTLAAEIRRRIGHVQVPGVSVSVEFKPTNATAFVTDTGLVAGTPAYLSPEQLRGEPADPRADVYAFGITGFVLLTGRLPFPGPTLSDYVAQHTAQSPPSLRGLGPPALVELLEQCLAKSASQRPADGRALAALCHRLPSEAPPKPRGKSGRVALAVALSGTRSSASARHISTTPSSVDRR